MSVRQTDHTTEMRSKDYEWHIHIIQLDKLPVDEKINRQNIIYTSRTPRYWLKWQATWTT
jgi:hypothetical protein